MVRRTMAALSLAAFTLSGCYSYRYAEPADVVAGTDVRLRLNAEEAGRLEESVGLTDRTISGSVVAGSSTSSWILETQVPGMGSNGMFQRVDVERAGVTEVEVKEFSALKTGLLGVGLGAVVAVVAAAAISGGPETPENSDVNPPDRTWIPIFSFSTR